MKKSYIVFILCVVLPPLSAEPEKPIDPFDYNFCGGERVYPIIGVNFSTACGPRNQVALGRRGKLMWLFPAGPDRTRSYKGQYKLSKEQLFTLSTLAEVAKITSNPQPKPHKIMYRMGINFSARLPKHIYSAVTNEYTPSNQLYEKMLSMVPESDKPSLPECNQKLSLFDPTQFLDQRTKKLVKKQLYK